MLAYRLTKTWHLVLFRHLAGIKAIIITYQPGCCGCRISLGRNNRKTTQQQRRRKQEHKHLHRFACLFDKVSASAPTGSLSRESGKRHNGVSPHERQQTQACRQSNALLSTGLDSEYLLQPSGSISKLTNDSKALLDTGLGICSPAATFRQYIKV